jgi:hypothetical protein
MNRWLFYYENRCNVANVHLEMLRICQLIVDKKLKTSNIQLFNIASKFTPQVEKKAGCKRE